VAAEPASDPTGGSGGGGGIRVEPPRNAAVVTRSVVATGCRGSSLRAALVWAARPAKTPVSAAVATATAPVSRFSRRRPLSRARVRARRSCSSDMAQVEQTTMSGR